MRRLNFDHLGSLLNSLTAHVADSAPPAPPSYSDIDADELHGRGLIKSKAAAKCLPEKIDCSCNSIRPVHHS